MGQDFGVLPNDGASWTRKNIPILPTDTMCSIFAEAIRQLEAWDLALKFRISADNNTPFEGILADRKAG